MGQGFGKGGQDFSEAALAGHTHWTKDEVHRLREHFQNNATRSGNPHMLSFSSFEKCMDDMNIKKDRKLLQDMFHALDKDDDGQIDFRHFVTGLSALLKGTLHERIELSFDIYDLDHSGGIRKEEMVSILSSMNKAIRSSQNSLPDPEDLMGIQQFVDSVFDKYDRAHDGQLNLEEYVEAVRGHPSLLTFQTKA